MHRVAMAHVVGFQEPRARCRWVLVVVCCYDHLHARGSKKPCNISARTSQMYHQLHMTLPTGGLLEALGAWKDC